MERTILTITPANIITVSICGALGYGLLVLANAAMKRMRGSGGNQ